MVDWQAPGPTPVGPESAAPELYAQTPATAGQRISAEAGANLSALDFLGHYNRLTDTAVDPDVQFQRDRDPDGHHYSASNPGEPILYQPPTPQSRMMDPAEYNKLYAPPGQSIGTEPMPELVARLMGARKFATTQRDDIIQRNASQHNWLTNFGIGTASFLADPVNAAAALVPGVGEEAVLGRLADMGLTGFGGRLVARGAMGAEGGAIGMVPQTAMQLAISHYTGANDYDLRSAFGDLAMGAAVGALLHSGVGLVRETGLLRPDAAMQFSAARRAESDFGIPQNQIVQNEVMKTAVAQVADGQPVDVQGLLDMAASRRAETELQAWSAQADRISKEGDTALKQALGADATATNLEDTAKAASDNLATMRQEHEGWKADLAAAQGRLETLTSDTTPARLAEINAELARPDLPAARRTDLQAEHNMLVHGSTATPESLALETSRTQSEITGITKGGARAEKQLAGAEKKAAALAEKSAKTARQSDASLRINAERVESRERVVHAMAARSLRRFAGITGIELKAGEADALARLVMSGEAKAADVLAELRSRKGGVPLAEPDANVRALVGRSADRLRSEGSQAAGRFAQAQQQLARDGYAMGMSQADLAETRHEVYGERPVPEMEAPKAAEGVDPQLQAANENLAGMSPTLLSASDRAALEGADRDIAHASSLKEAFAQAAQCLIGAGI